ncbi:xanthine dehydrogenase-like [Colias croceus]|uniref:xanthine dehydrogenase-like n=1 Tax=Colias crocea TaxID=72248 RepID=UPI001E27F31D|nr:xanthine dehydrogenase-like [Colias croceus]
MDNIEDFLPEKKDTSLIFFVNGKKVVEPQPDPEWTLLWYLRRKLHLTGTKYGCGEGGCGACTVMVSQYLQDEDRIKHYSVNACLMPLCTVHGMAITTVEGIGSTQDKLHPVQERIAKAHGSQCGFCTPGIVMSMYTLLRNKNKIDFSDIDTALQGNLCRCTGYRPIIEGFKTFLEEWEHQYNGKLDANGDSKSPCMMGEDCCRLKNADSQEKETLFDKSEFKPYSPTQEPIFPPELKINNKEYVSSLTYFKGPNIAWVRPFKLEELLLLKKQYPFSKIVAGNTEIGVEVKFKKMVYPILISPIIIKELNTIQVTSSGIQVGATVTLSDLVKFLDNFIKENDTKGKVLEAIKDMLHWFAGTQIRNTASLVGNIVTASPISDLNPILMASAATLTVKSLERGERKLTIDSNFFKGYRKVAIEEDEIVLFVEIPFTGNDQFVKAYKQAKRREDDISIVTAAFNVQFEKNNLIVSDAKLCFGGMAPTTVCATKTSLLMKGKHWDQSLLKSVFDSLTEEFKLNSSVPGGMPEYRKSLCLSLFFRFYLHILQIRSLNGTRPSNYELSGSYQIPALQPKSSQCFEIKNNERTTYDAVGKPIVHMSAFKQATGEAIYCDDLPTLEEELYLTLIYSAESHAKIKSIDASKALAVPGVVAFFSAADIPKERNKMGPILKDEEVFVSDVVTSKSCIVGAIVAKTEQIARRAKNLVMVSYEKIEPVVVTIEDAIAHDSYYPNTYRQLVHGDVQEAFKQSKHKKNGHIRIGAQEHFYLETVSAYAIRKEDELEVICNSQNPAEVAHTVGQVLNIPNHKVVSKIKRIGGGFGGKETRSLILALPVAVAAYRLKKPIRGVLDRDEDMQATGYRHPCLIKYQVAFDDTGKISGAIYDVYANGGNYLDISPSMLERVMTHLDNCCKIPNIVINLNLCKTNTPSNTAFRGFGGPQAMFATESMIRDVANALNKSYEEIITVNMYNEGDFTYYDQELIHCTIKRCWQECIETSNYWQRKSKVQEFNRMNRWKKKGLALTPTKYGISFQIDMLMQGGALVLIYCDGSVLISIGGIEMGQGLFTKMIQVASKVLDIEVSKIHISEMSTDKVPNSSPTAASVSSDLYGMAVLNACKTLNERLEPIKKSNPNGKWEDWISAAYLERISLSATGFYASPKIQFNPKTNSGTLFEYYTFGVACSEVEIDCLTGDHQVLRTDIVMDIGESLNPAIDIGQIEGGFMQGYGLFTMEEMLYSPTGEILSRGPGAYKIPGFSDIPKEFNVSLLKGAPNPRAVYSSKAVGEPPLFLAASVYFAIKEAIKSARMDSGVDPEFVLEAPATCARIRMACEDDITKQVKPTIENVGRPWNVIP